MTNLIFEKVGDIRFTYPYICIYDESDRVNPFMEIGITDDKQLQYTLYANARNVVLSIEDWMLIQDKALNFLPKAIADEE